MNSDRQLIESQIANTTVGLQTKLKAMEKEVEKTVDEVKSDVQEIVKFVTSLSPKKQIEKHPLASLGIAVAAGFLFGPKLFLPAVVGSRFKEEIGMGRSLLVGILTRFIADRLKQANPEYESEIGDLESAIVSKTSREAT